MTDDQDIEQKDNGSKAIDTPSRAPIKADGDPEPPAETKAED